MALFQVPRGDELQNLQATFDSGSSDGDVESAEVSGDVLGQSFAQKRKRPILIGGALIASLGALAVIVAHAGGDAKPFASVNVGGLEAKTGGAYPVTNTMPVVASTMPSGQPIPAPISSTQSTVPVQAPAPVSMNTPIAAPTPTQSVPVTPMTQPVPVQASAPVSTQSTLAASPTIVVPSAPVVSTTPSSSSSDIIPHEVAGDGDPCDSTTEEVHDGLCYEKCNTLTKGVYPYRLNAFCCCKKQNCKVSDLLTSDTKCPSMLPCGNGGFDVDADGKACPHPIGTCYNDEETLIGACYKKCTLLTGGKFPHRVGPATCCKSASDLSCLNPFNDNTNANFAVGGGKGDGNPATVGGVHEPITSLTETKK